MNNGFIGAFLVTGTITGIMLAWQLNTSIPVPTNFPSDQLEAKESLLKSYLDEQSYLQSRIVTLRQQIDKSRDEVEGHSEEANIALLNELKADIGLSEVTGEGLEILIDDSPLVLREGAEPTDVQLVQAADIRDLVNLLFTSNAEAIAVNQQRIVSTSPISSVGTSILINNSHVAPPFTITAVGDKQLMLKRMLDQKLVAGLYDRIDKENLIFQVTVSDRLVQPIYNGDLHTDYLNLVE